MKLNYEGLLDFIAENDLGERQTIGTLLNVAQDIEPDDPDDEDDEEDEEDEG